MRLAFLNANWLRQYPFRSDCGVNDVLGQRVPTDILAALRISVPSLSDEIRIGRLSTNNQTVSVEFYMGSSLIGSANGQVATSNQALPIVAANGGVIGSVTIGNPENCVNVANYVFDTNAASAGYVEPSTVSIVPAPPVTSWTVGGQSLVGNIVFASSSLNIQGTNLSVIDPTVISSRGDRHPEYLTCDLPVVGAINNTLSDHKHNIKFIAIEPLHITWLGGSHNMLQIAAPDIVLSNPGENQRQLCKTLNLPPDNLDNTPTGTLANTSAEYLSWPQFSDNNLGGN